MHWTRRIILAAPLAAELQVLHTGMTEQGSREVELG